MTTLTADIFKRHRFFAPSLLSKSAFFAQAMLMTMRQRWMLYKLYKLNR